MGRGRVKTPGRERIYPRDQNETAIAMWIVPRSDVTESENNVALPPRHGALEFLHNLGRLRPPTNQFSTTPHVG